MGRMLKIVIAHMPFQFLIISVFWLFVIIPKTDKNSYASCLIMLFIVVKIWPEIHLMSLKAIFIIFIMVTKMAIFDFLNL